MALDALVLMFRPPFAWREFLLQTWFVARVSLVPTVLLAIPFTVFVQHVTPGAFGAGLTLFVGTDEIVVMLVKAALFGLVAGLIACYKGVSVSGGPQGVGNAVNETVVFTVTVLFILNVFATAV